MTGVIEGFAFCI